MLDSREGYTLVDWDFHAHMHHEQEDDRGSTYFYSAEVKILLPDGSTVSGKETARTPGKDLENIAAAIHAALDIDDSPQVISSVQPIIPFEGCRAEDITFEVLAHIYDPQREIMLEEKEVSPNHLLAFAQAYLRALWQWQQKVGEVK